MSKITGFIDVLIQSVDDIAKSAPPVDEENRHAIPLRQAVRYLSAPEREPLQNLSRAICVNAGAWLGSGYDKRTGYGNIIATYTDCIVVHGLIS